MSDGCSPPALGGAPRRLGGASRRQRRRRASRAASTPRSSRRSPPARSARARSRSPPSPPPSPPGELDGARRVAAAVGIAHETIATDELAREGYRAQRPDRCYFCKTELYDSLAALAQPARLRGLLSGANADDAGDWRPGLRAAAEHGVRHPLLEAGVGKADVRALARELGLPSAEKPASPCLASRIPYGTAVDPDTLR